MLCAISGVAPEAPVASRKSGNVFERRLIESYIAENRTDPVNGEELAVEDLIELKSPRVVQPRPPTFTSIPSLLSAFQNEWDALALQTYELKQQLAQTRQELSTALYQHDAAVRVIARVSRERDEARDALSKLTVSGGAPATNGDAMQVDSQALPDAIADKVNATQQKLSSTRRKRPVPEDWADSETISSFDVTESINPSIAKPSSLDLQTSGNAQALVGSATDGTAIVSGFGEGNIEVLWLKSDVGVTDTCWWGSRAIVASSDGSIKVFENDSTEVAQVGSHAGAATSVCLHPCGDLLASTGVDKSYKFYDLSTLKTVSQNFTDSELTCGEFHPDGHLFAAGGRDGQIKLYEVNSGVNAANFDAGGPPVTLSFSENGTWLATAVKGQTTVSIWDLRKSATIKTLDIGSTVQSVKWDYTGQFLAAAGPGCVVVQHYAKSSKAWSEPFRKAVAAISVRWGENASSLKVLGPDGTITTLGTA